MDSFRLIGVHRILSNCTDFANFTNFVNFTDFLSLLDFDNLNDLICFCFCGHFGCFTECPFCVCVTSAEVE